jgi:tetratricopeptide (TPR) repeat protein
LNEENDHELHRPAGVAGPPLDVDRLLALMEAPEIRARIAQLIEESSAASVEKPSRWRRLGSLSGAISSTLIVLLAFLIPSVQDQWDRFQSRRVLQSHIQLGREFMREGKFKLAEESFAKAIEMAENKRPDLEEQRLEAKVQAVNADPDWGAKNPEGLEESEFLYLLHIQRDPRQAKARAATLSCYGVFLASAHRLGEAEEKIREAIRLNPEDSAAYINLGNLLRDRGQLQEAETSYREALKRDPGNSHIYYDLGLTLDESSRPLEAEKAFAQAVDCSPRDSELLRALAEQLDRNGKPVEARNAWRRLLSQTPDDMEAKQQLRRRSIAALAPD